MAVAARHINASRQLEASAGKQTSILAFFKRQFVAPVPIPSSTNLSDKTAIVSGANAGLGLESCRQLLRLQLQRLILAVRSQARGDSAAAKLREEFPSAQIEVWLLDMDSYASVQNFAERCRAEVEQHKRTIDMVLLNAGLQRVGYEKVPETKHERVLQVNYLSTMLLTVLLLPIMKQGHRQQRLASPSANERRAPVLSVVTSDMAYFTPFNADAPSMLGLLDDEPTPKKPYSTMEHYSQSKLLQLAFVSKLAEYIEPEDVVLNLVNPGFCRGTSFNDEVMTGLTGRVFRLFAAAMARTMEAGGSTYVDAVAIKGKESHGSMVSDWTIKPFPPVLYGESGKKVTEKLWEETMAEFEFAGARKIVAGLRD